MLHAVPVTESTYQLRIRQAYSLSIKIEIAIRKIVEWYLHFDGRVYVAFSGGKDSTVLLHLVRSMYPHVPAMYVNTGLEWPEAKAFVRQQSNVDWHNPTRSYLQVIKQYGFPLISIEVANKIYKYRKTKRPEYREKLLTGKYKIPFKWRHLLDAPFMVGDKCCEMMKIRPARRYEKRTGRVAYVGLLAAESQFRKMQYHQHGCNVYDATRPTSRPLSIWTDDDIWAYLAMHDLPYCSIYDQGYQRTSCVYCGFGLHREDNPNRFQRMKLTHPKMWRYCMDTIGLRSPLVDWVGVPIE